jgi:alcohol dehydrogenase class IV
MRSFVYDALPGRVVFGVGSLERLPEELEHAGSKRVLLVAGPGTRAIAEQLEEQLGDREVGIFDEVLPHVPADAAQAAVETAVASGADSVVTVGGGTTTGFGKAIVLVTGLTHVAVPTTYAGSEMTPIYGLTSGGEKRVARDRRVLPKVVIYDPMLTVSLPASVTGPSGMNALAHCVEALYARDANPITSLMAAEGIRALRTGIPAAVRDPADLDARSEALYGAYLAGAALGVVGMAIHHRICHVLGGTYGLMHGEVNSVILPQAVAFNREAAPDAIAVTARALGVDDAAGGLFDLATSIGSPTSLEQLRMNEADLDAAAEQILDPPPWNPRQATVAEVRRILDDAYHGRRPT